MANRRLSIDEVKNKHFTPVRFREGYEQEDVDDFFDEIEVTFESFEHELTVLKKDKETLLRDRERNSPAQQVQQANLPMVGIPQEILDAEVALREKTKKELDETEHARVEIEKLKNKAEFNFNKLEKIHRTTVAEKEELEKNKDFYETKIKNLDKELKELKGSGGAKSDTAELVRVKKSHERALNKVNKLLAESEEERKALEEQNQELLNYLFELQSGTKPEELKTPEIALNNEEPKTTKKSPDSTATDELGVADTEDTEGKLDGASKESVAVESLVNESSLVEAVVAVDEKVEEELARARAEADSILEAARAEADSLLNKAKEELQGKVKNLVSEQEFLENEVARLRSLESQAREELRTHYSKKLAEIDGRHTTGDKFAVSDTRGKSGLPAGRRRLEPKVKSVDTDEALPHPNAS